MVAVHECRGCGRRGSRGMIAREALCWSCWAQHHATTARPIPPPPSPERTAMRLTLHEGTLTAARQLLEAGPFWLLDLWESLSPCLQPEVVETLCSSTSFTAALEAAGFVEDDLGLDDDDEDDAGKAEGARR